MQVSFTDFSVLFLNGAAQSVVYLVEKKNTSAAGLFRKRTARMFAKSTLTAIPALTFYENDITTN